MMIMYTLYVHQQYYIISEQVFVQTYEDIIWLVFFLVWEFSVGVYFMTGHWVRPHYVTRKGPRQVLLLNQWSGTHRDVAMVAWMHGLPTPCLHDLTRNMFSQMWHQWHPKMSQCHVYLNPFTGTHSSAWFNWKLVSPNVASAAPNDVAMSCLPESILWYTLFCNI